jgi:hypothetical protein
VRCGRIPQQTRPRRHPAARSATRSGPGLERGSGTA